MNKDTLQKVMEAAYSKMREESSLVLKDEYLKEAMRAEGLDPKKTPEYLAHLFKEAIQNKDAELLEET